MSICGVLRSSTLPANVKITIALPSRASIANNTALAATSRLPRPRLLNGAALEGHLLSDGALEGHLLRVLAPLPTPGRSPGRLAEGFAQFLLARAPRCAGLRGDALLLEGAAPPRGTRRGDPREGHRAERNPQGVRFPRGARLEPNRPINRATPRPARLGAALGRTRPAGAHRQRRADLQKEGTRRS